MNISSVSTPPTNQPPAAGEIKAARNTAAAPAAAPVDKDGDHDGTGLNVTA